MGPVELVLIFGGVYLLIMAVICLVKMDRHHETTLAKAQEQLPDITKPEAISYRIPSVEQLKRCTDRLCAEVSLLDRVSRRGG